jgi:hypothetical protein
MIREFTQPTHVCLIKIDHFRKVALFRSLRGFERYGCQRQLAILSIHSTYIRSIHQTSSTATIAPGM